MGGVVYLIPVPLSDSQDALFGIPAEVPAAIKSCKAFFVENERTARRFLKKLAPELVIDDHQWIPINKDEQEPVSQLTSLLKEDCTIGIVSEAGCPGVADPGRELVSAAQKAGARVRPLTGPSSLLLALMASGMNGQKFRFHGYLPIDSAARKKAVRELEADALKDDCTQLFIETPYRNNALLKDIAEACRPETRLCIAVDLTDARESVRTRTIKDWKNDAPDLHKRPAIFLIGR